MPWKNGNEQDNQSYEDRCKEVEDKILSNIKKHELYLDIDYEELQNSTLFNHMKKKIMQNF